MIDFDDQNCLKKYPRIFLGKILRDRKWKLSWPDEYADENMKCKENRVISFFFL